MSDATRQRVARRCEWLYEKRTAHRRPATQQAQFLHYDDEPWRPSGWAEFRYQLAAALPWTALCCLTGAAIVLWDLLARM